MSEPDEDRRSAEGGATTNDVPPDANRAAADDIAEDDPHKVEKLSKLGHAGDEAAEGTE